MAALLLPALLPSALTARPLQRRSVLALAGTALAASRALPAKAADDELVKMYFGAGCFWHVQHEFVLKEAERLERRGSSFTALTGYAGGKALQDGKVCYHNSRDVADYGKLGHAEVVQVTIPVREVPAFADKFIEIFGPRGYRHDPQDRGPEYRSVLGLPGGSKSELFPTIEAAAKGSPMKLVAGKGDDADTLSTAEIFVMDSDQFPFYPAEQYHQFHNDFQGPSYGRVYNRLQTILANEGRIGPTGCPEEAF